MPFSFQNPFPSHINKGELLINHLLSGHPEPIWNASNALSGNYQSQILLYIVVDTAADSQPDGIVTVRCDRQG